MSTTQTQMKNIWILAFTLIVVMLGYGMVIPIIPFYIEQMGAGGTELGLLVASYALMRLVFGPVWGVLSDRFGRKPILMIGVFGYAVAMFFFGLATELWMLFAARILSGILSSATSPTTLAYISDSTAEEDRSGGMGKLGAAIGLGTILGPALGGLFASSSLAVPFFIAAGLSLVSVLLIYFLLPESLPVNQRSSSKEGLDVFKPANLRQALVSPVGLLFMLAFLVTTGVTIFYGIFGLYALERFGYGPEQVGIVLMVIGLVSALGQGVLSGPFANHFGESLVIKAAFLLSAFGYLAMIPAGQVWSFLLTTAFFILVTAIMIPPLTSMTSMITRMDQGITMGLSNSFMSLGRIVGPILGGFMFDLNIVYPLVAGAVVLLVGFGLCFIPVKASREPIALAK